MKKSQILKGVGVLALAVVGVVAVKADKKRFATAPDIYYTTVGGACKALLTNASIAQFVTGGAGTQATIVPTSGGTARPLYALKTGASSCSVPIRFVP